MKKAVLTIASILLVIFLNGCQKAEIATSDNYVSSIEEVQGFWYDEDTEMVLGFKENEYIIYGFGTQISIEGTFEINDGEMTLYSDEYSDKFFDDVIIEGDILSLKSSNGEVTEWKNISEEKVRSLLEEESTLGQTPTSTTKLPSSLAFLADLDPIQIDTGAYSFTGHIVGRGINSVTITASNGKSITTSDAEILYHTYRRADGSLGMIISDLTDDPYAIRGIPFTFVYGGSGALMLLKSPY